MKLKTLTTAFKSEIEGLMVLMHFTFGSIEPVEGFAKRFSAYSLSHYTATAILSGGNLCRKSV